MCGQVGCDRKGIIPKFIELYHIIQTQNCLLLLQDSHTALRGAKLSATAAPQPHGSLELFFVNILRSFDF